MLIETKEWGRREHNPTVSNSSVHHRHFSSKFLKISYWASFLRIMTDMNWIFFKQTPRKNILQIISDLIFLKTRNKPHKKNLKKSFIVMPIFIGHQTRTEGNLFLVSKRHRFEGTELLHVDPAFTQWTIPIFVDPAHNGPKLDRTRPKKTHWTGTNSDSGRREFAISAPTLVVLVADVVQYSSGKERKGNFLWWSRNPSILRVWWFFWTWKWWNGTTE